MVAAFTHLCLVVALADLQLALGRFCAGACQGANDAEGNSREAFYRMTPMEIREKFGFGHGWEMNQVTGSLFVRFWLAPIVCNRL